MKKTLNHMAGVFNLTARKEYKGLVVEPTHLDGLYPLPQQHHGLAADWICDSCGAHLHCGLQILLSTRVPWCLCLMKPLLRGFWPVAAVAVGQARNRSI